MTTQEKSSQKLRIFSERVRWKMSELGFQANELAERMGVEPSAVSNWMTGKNRAKGQNLRELARELGCSIAYLNGAAPPMVAPAVTHYGELAPMREEDLLKELDLWKRRTKAAEKKLAGLRAMLRAALEASSDSPSGGGSELVSMLRAAGDQAEAELPSPEPKPGAAAPSDVTRSPSGVSSLGSSGGTLH